uniref:Uncharacterized protein n=1 Tax=Monopterus albus TaxID=43700 RepID=A0A3Q3K195_MONAL
MSLSQRLVSLINLAKDSLCLPEFVTNDQSCLLIILQKIISASEIHLKQSVRQQKISAEAKGLAAEQPDSASSPNESARVTEKDRKENEKLFRLHSSHLSIIQGIVEETAIVKAILSVLLPLFYEHKNASQFYMIFKDAFPIVCQLPLPQQYIEEEEKNQLKDAVTEELQRRGFHSNTEILLGADPQISASNWSSTTIVKWLVMDGEPVGQPGWLDYLITLCDPEDPFLFLSTGETLVPSHLHLKLLMEVTDLSNASPSAVTRCSLVHFTGTDLWKAVWKSEMDALYCEHRLDHGTFEISSEL